MAEAIKVYTLEEVMEILKVSRRTIYNYIKADQLKAIKVGREWRVTEKALAAFLETGTEEGYYQKVAYPSQTSEARRAKRGG
jgi:excisionase family DNA binding protein